MGLFSKWRKRRKQKKAERQNRRLERMSLRNERVKIRGQYGGGIGGAIGNIAKNILGGGDDTADNSPVTGSGSPKTEIINMDSNNMMKYLPYVGGLVLAYFLFMKKGR